MMNRKSSSRKTEWPDRHYLETLRTISTEAPEEATVERRLSWLVEVVAKELHWDVCSIYLVEWDKEELVLAATFGLESKAVGKLRLPLTEGLVGKVVREDKALFLEEVTESPHFKFFPETGEERYHSMAAVPFRREGKVIGVLTVQTIHPYPFSSADSHFLEILANQIGQTVGVAFSLEALGEQKGRILTGTPGAPGVVEGPVHLIYLRSEKTELLSRKFRGIKKEKELFEKAVMLCRKDLTELIDQIEEPQSPAAQILRVHQMMVSDPGIKEKVYKRIEEKKESAPRAVVMAMEQFIEKFAKLDSHLIREKVQDLKDLRDSLLRFMGGKERGVDIRSKGEPVVIVAQELTPQETIRLDPRKVAAIALEKGSEFSHGAIIARSLKLPAVVGIPGLMEGVKQGDRILLDGNTGFIYVNPHLGREKRYLEKLDGGKKRIKAIRRELEGAPSSTRGLSISLHANIGHPFEVELAISERVEAIGLLRTEFYYMGQSEWPGEKSHVRFYEQLLQSFSHGVVTIRLLDLGDDKFLPYMPQLGNNNSPLGARSIRLLLDHPEILRSQLEAIHKASVQTGCLPRILVPMVTQSWEVEAVREILCTISGNRKYPLGIMVESPAALFQIEELTEKSDFFSIGTNDLAQYLLVADRNQSAASDSYTPFHPALLRSLSYLFEKLKKTGKEFSVCGEMAGGPLTCLALLILGYRRFSVSPSRVAEIRYLSQKIPKALLEESLPALLGQNDPNRGERELQGLMKKMAPLLVHG